MQDDLESRSSVSNPLGKCSERLDLLLTESTLDGITALASLAGKTKTEYARQILEQHVHGSLQIARARAHVV